MKKTFLILSFLGLLISAFAQIPNSFSYQAVVRNSDQTLLKNQEVTIKATILRNDEALFEQTQTATTNENGLLTIVIGNESFQDIDWLQGTLFIKTQIDPAGGNNFTIETQTQLLTVPYSMAAKTAETAVTVEGLEDLIERVNNLETQVEELYNYLNSACESELFYYFYDEKIFLSDCLSKDWLVIGYEKHIQDEDIINLITQTGFFQYSFIHHTGNDNLHHRFFSKTKKQHTCSQLKEISNILKQSDLVSFANYIFEWGNNNWMFYCDDFVVKLKDETDLSDLYVLVQETNTYIKRELNQNTYVIGVNKNSSGNALQMANFFFETEKFEWTETIFTNYMSWPTQINSDLQNFKK